jgi:DNA-binding CsgD family transcriptional regulator
MIDGLARPAQLLGPAAAPMRAMPKIDDDRLQTLIGHAYDAAIDAGKWQTFIDHFAGGYRSRGAIFTQALTNSGATVHVAVNLGEIRSYEQHFSKIKPWRGKLARSPVGAITLLASLIDERSLEKCEYYNDFMAPRDLYYSFVSVLRRDGRDEPVETTLTIVRSRRLGDFSATELKFAEDTMPHLLRALQMHRCLAGAKLQEQALLSGLDRLRSGVLVAAKDGALLFANNVAEELLRDGDGLRTRHGRLCAATPAVTEKLLGLIYHAAETGANQGRSAGGVLRLARRAGSDLHLLICPLPIDTSNMIGPAAPTAIIFISERRHSTAFAHRHLEVLYGLSAAESRLVAALVAGVSISDYSARAGISVATAKTQLQSVFAKTGQNRQIDVVRHVLSSPILQLARDMGPPSSLEKMPSPSIRRLISR